MAEINSTISVTTLNVNGFNNPVIRQRFSDWRKKKDKIQLHVIYRRHILHLKIQIN